MQILHKIALVYLHNMFIYTACVTGHEGRNTHKNISLFWVLFLSKYYESMAELGLLLLNSN